MAVYMAVHKYSFLAIHLNKIGFLAAYKFYVAIKFGIKHWSDLVNPELSLWPNFGKIMWYWDQMVCSNVQAPMYRRILNGAINKTDYIQRIYWLEQTIESKGHKFAFGS